MRITVTQEHFDKANRDSGVRTLAQTCPIWQAFHELGLETSVGWTGNAYVIFRTESGMPVGQAIARIEFDTPLYNVADWFDAPNMYQESGKPIPTLPVTGEIEMLA